MSDYYTESQMQRIEQAAYDGAMLEACKEWERQCYEFDALIERLVEVWNDIVDALIERLVEVGNDIVDALIERLVEVGNDIVEEAQLQELGAQEAERKEFCPNCEAETPCTHEAELFVCDICGEDFAKYIVSRNCNLPDVSTTQNVTTPEPPEDALTARIAELEAENNRLAELLHNELSSLEIATDLGNKRWTALNKIYEDGEKHNTNWCKRIAQEGLGVK